MKKRGINVRKELLLLFSASVLLTLSGCSQAQIYLEEKMWQNSGISADQDFQEYERLAAEGYLDARGIYQETEKMDVELTEPSGSIHITFAENSFLEFTYYSDSDLTSEIDTQNCYLNPGQSIYASAPKVRLMKQARKAAVSQTELLIKTLRFKDGQIDIGFQDDFQNGGITSG